MINIVPVIKIMKLQFNKLFLKKVQDDFKMRSKLIPILKTKELVLRQEINKTRLHLKSSLSKLNDIETNINNDLKKLSIDDLNHFKISIEVETKVIKKSGVTIQCFDSLKSNWTGLDLCHWPAWYSVFIEELISLESIKQIIKYLEIEIKTLDDERRKTTCRINLYEKVHIPELKEAELKIKRYLEDIENLEKSSQKLLKKKLNAS